MDENKVKLSSAREDWAVAILQAANKGCSPNWLRRAIGCLKWSKSPYAHTHPRPSIQSRKLESMKVHQECTSVRIKSSQVRMVLALASVCAQAPAPRH
jgi:hypothetical protein